jgi:hypothetical protein
MNSYALARAIRGPIILITIGLLFAIDQFYSLSFDRTWPILIIVIGLLKLLERSVAPPDIPGPPPFPPSNVPSSNVPGGNPQ